MMTSIWNKLSHQGHKDEIILVNDTIHCKSIKAPNRKYHRF